MMHGPCGTGHQNSPCMENGKCKKSFPKQFINNTLTNVEGYPVYRRRQGETANVRGVTMDNRNVVPYNPLLLLKYNSHINLEVCTSVVAIKYIYKYLYKGFDCANITITSDGNQQLTYDEVTNYINCRYVSAPEAIWRLRENKMHDRSHALYRLPVHLPNQQNVVFEEGNEEEAASLAETGRTKLEKFFELNTSDETAREFVYTDIPYHYVFNRNWNKRQRGENKIVARMYTVSPKDEERFYLRILLLHVQGPMSFEDLRTYDGVVHATFKEASVARGLLETDDEWISCLQEASTYQMPRKLRETFALWEQFRDDFILDYNQVHSEEVAINLALHDIQRVLMQHGLSCGHFLLPTPQGNPPQEDALYDIAFEAFDAQERIGRLNDMQREAFDAVRHCLDYDDRESRCFFINGPGGSGKTYLYATLMAFVRGQDRIALPFATTGIAATLLKGGRTVHSGFKLPIPLLDTSVSSMRLTSSEAQILRDTALIIIDEVSMLTKEGLRCIERLLREIMQNDRPFGGKVFVIGGDFRQTLPVVMRGTRSDVIECCIKSSPLWRYFQRLTLSVNMRSEGQREHNEWLLRVGEGTLPRITGLRDPDLIEIPQHMIENENLIDSIFGKNPGALSDEELSRRAIVVPTNAIALEMNREIISRLPNEPMIYYSADSVMSEDPDDELNFPMEFLNDQTPSGMPPHVLLLKRGVPIMLLRNINPKKGLCNGTRMIVEQMSRSTITARIISERNQGDLVIIPRIIIAPSDTGLPFVLRRRQFPVIPAYVVTMNKSQGQSYDVVGIHLELPVFSHGQLYVALSRTRDGQRLKVKIIPNHEQGQLKKDQREFTRNVVYKEIIN